jgi:hypothetical protein
MKEFDSAPVHPPPLPVTSLGPSIIISYILSNDNNNLVDGSNMDVHRIKHRGDS